MPTRYITVYYYKAYVDLSRTAKANIQILMHIDGKKPLYQRKTLRDLEMSRLEGEKGGNSDGVQPDPCGVVVHRRRIKVLRRGQNVVPPSLFHHAISPHK